MSEWVQELRGLGVVGGVDVVDEVLAARGQEAVKRRASAPCLGVRIADRENTLLCEAMVWVEDRLEMRAAGRSGRARLDEARGALRGVRRRLEVSLWT